MRRYLIILTTILVGIWWYPRKGAIPYHPWYVGHYRGLGFADTPGYFGKNYYAVTAFPTEREDGSTRVSTVNLMAYNRFRGHYASGQVREEGQCFVSADDFGLPQPDLFTVKHGKYYLPDGSLGSEVVGGNGKQTYWTLDGIKVWEATFKQHRQIYLKIWDRSGTLIRAGDSSEKRLNGLIPDLPREDVPVAAG